ncbi:hydroxyacid dehydrogenase [Agromyces sp. MMS17-SY077]|uniref:Hydroxyacid dehydrogenase n=1 Tax=Agromyces seonyuensis TaxID=2662446 RepID=A0A6I4NWK2_9MICO|nr:hydroxyacid dehydrogenase [Agromyces seonyuensis]
MRARLAARLPDAVLEVRTPAQLAGAPEAFDLLVLPYLGPASAVAGLAGSGIRLVQAQTLGYDGIAAHLPDGITFCNAVGVHEASTAELVLALVLAAQRGIPAAVRDAAAGSWRHERRPGLAGRRVLLVGVGGVGREVQRRLEPFDVELVLAGRTARPGVLGADDLLGALPGADIVVVAVPLGPETTGLVDARFLAAMKPGALLVNVARGPVVDTDALVEAVRAGRVRAALDVTDPEPLPPGHPLWELPGVLITPHLGGDTAAMDARIDDVIVEQVRRLAAGEPPANAVLGPALLA